MSLDEAVLQLPDGLEESFNNTIDAMEGIGLGDITEPPMALSCEKENFLEMTDDEYRIWWKEFEAELNLKVI